MIKSCAQCKQAFKTHDSRRKTCGKVCGQLSRVVNAQTLSGRFSGAAPNLSSLPRQDLPPPEELPAPYAKRVYDMWCTLVGSGDAPTRIA